MNPLLREDDLLEVARCGAAGALPGDVIAFVGRGSEIIVHRVVAAGPEGLTTRGDNNSCNDDAPVRPAMLIGRVTRAWRGSAEIAVAGGRRGLLVTRILRLRRACRRRLVHVLHGPWRILCGAVTRLALPGSSPP
jgi:hypothetical protein